MIEVINKQLCTGCCACMNVCSKRCITMESDYEGFWYPKVDKTACNSCGLCEDVCPLLEGEPVSVERLIFPQVFAAWNKDHTVRFDSTSGGIFSALADKMFDSNGFVAGAVYQKDHTVSHIVTNDRLMLYDIRSSKYLQSYANKLFNEIKQLLESDKKVLVCATPCQIAGLYSVLGKDYEKLITCDFICIGVGSPKVFVKYVEMLEHKYGARATNIKFKNKTFGWHRFATRIDFANGKTYIRDRYNDPYMRSLLYARFVRPSCYACRFKGMPRKADITLADFWGIDKINPELDNDCGTSAVIVNSQKGKDFFQGAGKNIFFQECSLHDVATGNRAISQSIEHAHGREQFFSDIDKKSFSKLTDEYFPALNLISRIKFLLPSKYKEMARMILVYRQLGFSCSSWFQFIYINLIRRFTLGKVRFGFVPTPHSRLVLDKSAQIITNAILILGSKQNRKSTNETLFSLGKNSSITINGLFSINSGSDIRVYDNGELILNGGFCNVGTQIVCFKKISIGKGCAIARDVVIQDTDAHQFLYSNHDMSQEIFIGENVWIGYRAMILKGVTIGNGAVIAAGSIVTKDVPARCIVAGVPAKVIRHNIEWL